MIAVVAVLLAGAALLFGARTWHNVSGPSARPAAARHEALVAVGAAAVALALVVGSRTLAAIGGVAFAGALGLALYGLLRG